jgi:hypothetical protein
MTAKVAKKINFKQKTVKRYYWQMFEYTKEQR